MFTRNNQVSVPGPADRHPRPGESFGVSLSGPACCQTPVNPVITRVLNLFVFNNQIKCSHISRGGGEGRRDKSSQVGLVTGYMLDLKIW